MIIEGVSYLTDPNKQFSLRNGSPNVGGFVNVFHAGTDDPATTYSDFNGTRNARNILLDNNGRAIIIADATKAYRVEVRDPNGGLLWTVEPAYCIGGGGGGGVFPLVFTRNGFAAGSYDPLVGATKDINETEPFNITQPGIYGQIVESIGSGRLPVVTTGADGKVRRYYYTSREVQAGTITFTCGHDGIVEMLVLHSDGTYELMSISGKVSVIKGNCDDHQITPGSSAPTDFDCYEVEKEGSDIWIGDDNRVHAKAGWYHVDMGVYVDPADRENFVDARATIFVGAYVGDAPLADFNWSDYASVELDLSYDHELTQAVGFDIHVDNDGDVIHLSAGAPYGDYTAECILDWFSVHRIVGAGSGSTNLGGGGGDCNVHVIDLQLLESMGDDLWVECVSALLDGKMLAIRINAVDDSDNLGFVCWCEQTMTLPSGYTKDSYIAYLRTAPLYATLTFFARNETGGVITEGFKFTISPTVGLRMNYLFIILVDVGIPVTGNSDTGEFGSDYIFNIDYTDPDNPRTTSECLGVALIDLQNRGFELFLSCWNSTGQFQVSGPCYIWAVNPLMLRCHCIANYYADPDGMYGERLPVDYHLHLTWNAGPSWTETQGYYTICEDEVYPLALDSRFNGPVYGGESAQ